MGTPITAEQHLGAFASLVEKYASGADRTHEDLNAYIMGYLGAIGIYKNEQVFNLLVDFLDDHTVRNGKWMADEDA